MAYVSRLGCAFAVWTALTATPAVAQGVFNMGGLTGTLSQDGVTQSERARAGRGSASSSKARARQNCATVPRLRARYGANHPPLVNVQRLCRKLGYPTQ